MAVPALLTPTDDRGASLEALISALPAALTASRPSAFPALGEVDTQLWAVLGPAGIPVCGTDEAGAGPLAGPLVAAAVVLPTGFGHPLLRDSKQMTERQRSELYEVIVSHPDLRLSVAVASSREIDRVGIRPANLWAMATAARGVLPGGGVVLSDARDLDLGPAFHTYPLIKGDQRSLAIAAASVVAKVTRDGIMMDLDRVYPGYGFAEHKGYPTRAHREAIATLGPSRVHRRSFQLLPRS